jgi:two-component system, chemotaxis family, sensor kinase Cph1
MQSLGDGLPTFDHCTHSEIVRDEAALALTCPDSIQPHGVLLLIDPATWAIRAASQNVASIFGHSCEQLFEQSLADLLTVQDLNAVGRSIDSAQASRLLLTHPSPLSLVLHPTTMGWICEFESHQVSSDFSLLGGLQQTLDRLTDLRDSQSLLELSVTRLCEMTGFERGMVYRFDSQGAGVVLVDVKPDEAIAYLGLHFPASDIPPAVRQIYAQGLLRYIPDLNAAFVSLQKAPDFLDSGPIDLSQSLLRSVDPCCIRYHQNMEVGALMVIPLRVNQELWGLISLHHSEPLDLAIQVRDAASLLGQTTALALANALNADKLAYEQRLKRSQLALIQAFSESEKFEEVLIQPNLHILELVRAQGAALCLDNGITLIGETPDGDDVFELLHWMKAQMTDCVYATHQLPKEFEPAIAYKDKVSGALLLSVSAQQNFSILWFRPEQVQTIDWAGNPSQAYEIDESGHFGPRQSFTRWQEQIQLTANPWLESEIENALGLRAAISGIALQKAAELIQINQELERSNEELASFAYAASHDLKEPLRGIYNYTTFLLEDYADQLDGAGIERMNALLRLTKRMEKLIDALLKFSQMRQVEFALRPLDLQRLVDTVVETLRISRREIAFEVNYPRSLPEILGDSILLQELFSNLLSNALKYNEAELKTIEIGFVTPTEQQWQSFPQRRSRQEQTIFYVRDNGIGIRPRHQQTIFRLFKRLHGRDRYGGGTGVGLTIVKKIIERHGGEIWVESHPGQGTSFWFSLT